MSAQADHFRILTIDGGGIRGVFPAHLLSCLSERLGIKILDQFHMISGTSTGAIIAAAVAQNIDAKKIVNLYKSHGKEIFSFQPSYLPKKYRPALNSIYGSKQLKKILSDIYGDVKLGEISVPLMIPATDIGAGTVHVFKSSYSKDFTRDKNVLLRNAVLASCSAPTFFDPVKVGEYLLADGGLWASNPSLAAVIDAQRRLSVELPNIRILSIGTGHPKTTYGVEADKKWGLLNGWRGTEFISFLMSLQSQSTHNYLQLMLKSDQVLRLDFETDLPLALDDCMIVDDLISRADRLFTHKTPEIKKFFNLK